jgi:hypothetical protein
VNNVREIFYGNKSWRIFCKFCSKQQVFASKALGESVNETI